ncbi:hypothetical protein MLD38_016460 [Melastoma candidum]|uniref:Uncharacterized protein n=3 Tax=Melastoma candidum TaxID=119954 RepID=A0ACB9QN18_9MYRT|nr:hypothetical protein MLD38_016460 [Melastoma candidum]
MMLRRVSSRLLKFQLPDSRVAAFSPGTPDGSRGYAAHDEGYVDVPRPPKSKSERKPYVTPMKELIRRAKGEREARKLNPCRLLEDPPDNGLLVPELVDVAHRVHRYRESLLRDVSQLLRLVPVQRCRFCSEVHIGQAGHEIRTCTGPKSGLRSATHVWTNGDVEDVVSFPKCFHLFDRVGKPRVVHDERRSMPKVPAVVELCIQAGLDLRKYPTRRRMKPVYSIEGRIVEFEDVADITESEMDLPSSDNNDLVDPHPLMTAARTIHTSSNSASGMVDWKQLSMRTLETWTHMVDGVKKMMESYKVWTCGYCPEVQVGPKGHKVRMCKASRHQSRNGLHAWQEATVEDIIGYNYVWHVENTDRPDLYNNLKRYYGKAPAVVELCVRGGAPIPDKYRSMMRVDVVHPNRDEVDLIA